MRLQDPLYLFLLLLPVIFWILWKVLDKKRDSKIREHFSRENIEDYGLIDASSKKKKWFFRSLLLLSFCFLSLALSRPQFGLKQKNVLVSESSVVFLIDLSRSMLTRDLSPSRLEVLKSEVIQSLKKLAEVRVGLVVFAGSVIGKDKKSDAQKVIVLFSDGEDHQEQSLDYVKKMSKEGYKIFTVGVGTESGGFVPEGENSSSYIKDVSGQTVVSKPNFKFLKQVAKAGRGSFFFLSPARPLSVKLKSSLDKLEGVTASKRQFVVRNELYQGFVVLSVLILVLSLLVKRL